MSFVLNAFQQYSLFDLLGFLSPRKQKVLEKSWCHAFSQHVFNNIDEMIFAPLYSEKRNSRPNAPINVIVGALILKDYTGLTEDDLIEACMFDYRFQYALHLTSFEDVPLSDRTFSRFRERCAAYELTTGIDLIHECFVSLAQHMQEFMNISPNIKRMDSMMVESNIRKMGRLELLYTCLANLVREIHRDGRLDLIEGLEHYADPNDRNRVIYYDKDTPQAERLQKVIDDACRLLPKCAEDYSSTEDYQLLVRAINEQTKKDDDDRNIPKSKEDGMDSSILQNPSDPDATYRVKAGKSHRGYVANITEAVDENGSIVTDYQYDVNTRSDSDFLREAIENMPETNEPAYLIADGAYSSEEIARTAAEKNISIVTTGLLGRQPRPILSEFQLDESGHLVISCPAGNAPKSCSFSPSNNSIRVSFPRECCEGCPHREACSAQIKPRSAVIIFSVKTREKAVINAASADEAWERFIGCIRNGVETVPSILRRKYHVDRIPVRGRIRTKQFFGFKLAAFDFSKLFRYTKGLTCCRSFTGIA